MARRARVLVVDDDLDALYYVDHLLAELGHYPLKVTSIDDAADVVGAISFDAVIVGFEMIVTASSATLSRMEQARHGVSILIMAKPSIRPEGCSSSLRCFTEHPPGLDELRGALKSCARVTVRSGR